MKGSCNGVEANGQLLCGGRVGGKRKVLAADAGLGLIDARAEILERVGGLLFAPDGVTPENRTGQGEENDERRQNLQMHLGDLQHDPIENSLFLGSEARRRVEIGGLGEFAIQIIEDGDRVHMQCPGHGFDVAANVDRRAERAEITIFQGPNMLGLDHGGFGHLMNGEFAGLAGSA